MRSLMHATRAFYRDEAGVTAVEYGLIASLVALAIIVGATALGVNLNALFNYIAGKVAPPAAPPPAP